MLGSKSVFTRFGVLSAVILKLSGLLGCHAMSIDSYRHSVTIYQTTQR